MHSQFSEIVGREFVNFARLAIRSEFTHEPVKVPDTLHFRQSKGVYVSLEKDGQNRGSSGFPIPGYSIGDAIVRAARAAAFLDTRFKPVLPDELDSITIEVSILSELEPINGDVLEGFELGKDGLACKFFGYFGLILPQEARGSDPVLFLENLSERAGVLKDYWKKPGMKFFRFHAQVFREPVFEL